MPQREMSEPWNVKQREKRKEKRGKEQRKGNGRKKEHEMQ
jgi:hypothetical protein